MKYHLLFFVFGFCSVSMYSMESTCSRKNIKSNEEIIRQCLGATQKTNFSWNQKKLEITRAIDAGVSTVDIRECGSYGDTPLLAAVKENDVPFAQFLLNKKANPNFGRPIFSATSVQMAQLLKEYGADLQVVYGGNGFKMTQSGLLIRGGSNLLYVAICNTEDTSLFTYYLKQGLDLQKLTDSKKNLWYMLLLSEAVDCSACSEKRFMEYATLLHEFGVSSHHKDECGYSAIDQVEDEINKNNDRRLEDKRRHKESQEQRHKLYTKYFTITSAINTLKDVTQYIPADKLPEISSCIQFLEKKRVKFKSRPNAEAQWEKDFVPEPYHDFPGLKEKNEKLKRFLKIMKKEK